MRSVLRFAFVGVPTAVLAAGAVVAVSRNDQSTSALADGDLQRDLKLASTTSIELAPVGPQLATVSSIEAPPAAAPTRATKPKRSRTGTRALRSPRPAVRAAPEPEVAEAPEESQTTTVAESAGESTEATAVAPAEGGVALPRPTAIPVSFPGTGEGGMGGGDVGGSSGTGTDGGWGGVGTVIRGGGVDGDHCQIHRGGILIGRRPPVYGRPRISLGDRVRGATMGSIGESRPRSLGDRVRSAQGRSSGSVSTASRSSGGGSLGARVRAARGR